MAEAARFTRRRREILDFLPIHPHDPLHDHLSDPLAGLNNNRGLTQVNDDDLNLAAVVRIDGSGTIEQGHSLPERETAARPDLRFETDRKRDRDARGYERALQRRNLDITIKIRADIHACGPFGHISRQQRLRRAWAQALDLNANFFHHGPAALVCFRASLLTRVKVFDLKTVGEIAQQCEGHVVRLEQVTRELNHVVAAHRANATANFVGRD